jgi:hypothetical protein
MNNKNQFQILKFIRKNGISRQGSRFIGDSILPIFRLEL